MKIKMEMNKKEKKIFLIEITKIGKINYFYLIAKLDL